MRPLNIICTVALPVMLVACAHNGQTEKAEAKLLVERMFETFNRHDASGLSEFYSEDAIVISPEQCDPTIGRAAIQANYQGLFDAIPDVSDRLDQIVIDRNNIAVTFVASSQIEGAEFELPIAAVLTLRDGLFVKDVVYFDTDETPDCR